jgi:hypothetical protein
LGAPAAPLKLATDEDHGDPSNNTATDTAPPDRDEYEWQWTVSDQSCPVEMNLTSIYLAET